ncbi:MAG: NAD-dependent malic enzyme, partial [Deltaproteobacteria bacterium]
MQIEKGTDKLVKTLRIMIKDAPGYLGKLATTIGSLGGNIGDIKLIRFGMEYNIRDFTVFFEDEEHLERVLEAIGKIEGVVISDVIDPVLELHRGGKIRVRATCEIEGISTVRKIYTPGVAKVCRMIQEDRDNAYDYTSIGNTVAIVTNGSAILGLGDIGPVPGMPVMEGKAVLFDYL